LGVKCEDNALLHLLEGNDGLARLFDRYPEDLVGVVQERIAHWRFPRQAPLGDQVDSIAGGETLAQIASAWGSPLFDLNEHLAAELAEAQERKDTVSALRASPLWAARLGAGQSPVLRADIGEDERAGAWGGRLALFLVL
jgi:hypothetical protein